MAHTKECIKAWKDYRKAWQDYKEAGMGDMKARQVYFDAGDTYAMASSVCSR